MYLVSNILDGLAMLAGPRARHDLYINRLKRWGGGEPEWQILDQLVDPKRAAVDAGANSGTYAARLAQLCPKVYAFEPVPWLTDELARNLHPNVEIHGIALSNREGEAVMRIPVEDHCLATLDAHNPLPTGMRIREVPCRTARLDDVVFEPVGFLKIDVEGHELSVLEGAMGIIRKHRPALLIESQKHHNPDCPEAIFRLLRQEGYAGFFLRDGARHDVGDSPPEDVVNYVFLPKTDG